MASRVFGIVESVFGIVESIHSKLRPVLSKIEVNSFFGILDLRVGSLVVAIIQIILAAGSSYEKSWFEGTCYLIMAIVLIIGAALDLKCLAVPWLLLTFCFECILIGCMIIDLLNVDTDGYKYFFVHFFSFVFHLLGFSIVYSYYMKVHDLPAVNNPV